MSFIHVSVAAVTAEPDHFFVCFRQETHVSVSVFERKHFSLQTQALQAGYPKIPPKIESITRPLVAVYVIIHSSAPLVFSLLKT